MIKLKKTGLYFIENKQEERVEDDLGFVCHLQDSFSLDVDEPPTLSTLVKWFQDLGEDLLFVEMYTGCRITPYLSKLGAAVKETEPLKSISVSAYLEFDDYDGSSQGDFSVSLHHQCSGINMEGEHQAIEFSPWEGMLNVALSIEPKLYMNTMSWTSGDGSKPKIVDGVFNGSGRTPTSTATLHRLDKITFGDWLLAMCNELCWFDSPEKRDEEFKGLLDLVKDIKDTELQPLNIGLDALEFNDDENNRE